MISWGKNRMKCFHSHPPIPCIRQQSTQNCTGIKRTQLSFSNQDRSQDYCFCVYCHLIIAIYEDAVATRTRWYLQNAELKVYLCVYTCVQAHLKMAFLLYSMGLFSRRERIIFFDTLQLNLLKELDGLTLKM